jgi:hypothetical protein
VWEWRPKLVANLTWLWLKLCHDMMTVIVVEPTSYTTLKLQISLGSNNQILMDSVRD